METIWKSPIASTAFLDTGAAFVKLGGRAAEIRFSFESLTDEVIIVTLCFDQIEWFGCTYLLASDLKDVTAYDCVVDLGLTQKLGTICANLANNGSNSEGLRHLICMFDDGPKYEFICRSFSQK